MICSALYVLGKDFFSRHAPTMPSWPASVTAGLGQFEVVLFVRVVGQPAAN